MAAAPPSKRIPSRTLKNKGLSDSTAVRICLPQLYGIAVYLQTIIYDIAVCILSFLTIDGRRRYLS
jgi:hypothetical protein